MSLSSGALVNGRVLSMERPDAEAQALLWADGRVVLVGTNDAVRQEALRRGISPLDVEGRVVLPGFVDAHTHFVHVGIKRNRPDLRGTRTRQEALRRITAWLQANAGSRPVIAEGWDETDWPDRARLLRDELDLACAAAGQAWRPLVARRICGHIATANSAALPVVRARWDSDDLVRPDTGALVEQPSLYLNEVFPATPEELDGAIQAACAEAHRLGVTSLGDYSQAPYREALLRAARAGRLTVRIAGSIYTQQLANEIARGFCTTTPAPGPDGPSPWLRDGGLKVFLDGSLGARTAALRSPYVDAPKEAPTVCPAPEPGAAGRTSRFGCVGHLHAAGTLNWSDSETSSWFRQAHASGIQLHAHAIGDAAIDQGLACFEALEGKSWGDDQGGDGPAEPRHRFEHYEIVHPGQQARTAKLGVVASSQPNFVGTWSSKGGMYEDRLGARFGLNNRFQDMLQAGIRIAFGSDGMPFGPLEGLAAAVGHPEASQRMTPHEAIWHYTLEAAWSLHWENEVGSLAPGKWADIVLLETNDLGGDPNSWGIRQTWTAGTPRL